MSGENTVKIGALRRIFKRVHLGGLIDECVLREGNGGVNTIQAIDLTNSLVVSVAGKTKFEDFKELGISDLGTICKYLDGASDDTEIIVEENRLIFKSKNGKFKYLLSQPDLIPTTLDDKNVLTNLIEECTHEVIIQEEFHKQFTQSMSLTKTNNVSITVGETVFLSGGLESEHQFTLKIGKPEAIGKAKDKKYTLPIYGSHLGSVLNVLDFTVRENLPSLLLKEGKPIIVKQGKDCWALTIITDK